MISRILNFKRALVKCLIFSIFSCVFLDAKPTSSNILVDLNEDANHSFNLSDFQFNDVNGSQIILTPLLFLKSLNRMIWAQLLALRERV